jgi:tellurite resistance protein
MSDSEIRALLTIALMAALADGGNDDRERAALKSLATRIGEGRIDLTDVYDDVLLRNVSIAQLVPDLSTPEIRRQAYETAVAVANADGVHSPAEGEFLRNLAAALGLPQQEAQGYLAQADAVAQAAGVAGASGSDPARPAAGHVLPDAAALEQQIVSASVTNAALELLPNRSPRWRYCRCKCASSTGLAKPTAMNSTRDISRNSSRRSASGSPDSILSSSAANC